MTSASSLSSLRGMRCAVLGSTTGIGRSTALLLAEAGADVIIHGRASQAEAISLVEQIQAMGQRAEYRLADLTDRSQRAEFADWAWNQWNGLDAWLQIAGADVLTGSNAKLDVMAKLDLLLETDVHAAFHLTRLIGQRMKTQGHGAIVTMGWDQADTGMEGDSGEVFALVKGAIHAFTRSLALSLAPQVRVNAVAPGWIKTEWGETASNTWQERVLKETPLARWGFPNDVAKVARFLVSPESQFLTGQIIRVNGGAVR